MYKLFCDMCGKSMHPGSRKTMRLGNMLYTKSYDLCSDCFDKIQSMLAKETKPLMESDVCIAKGVENEE